MTEVSALPSFGDVLADSRRPDRALRVAWHPAEDLLVLSMWRSNRCLATCRLSRADAAELVSQLAAGLAATPRDAWTAPTLGALRSS